MEQLELHNDFKDFLRSLNSAKVEYLLIGGYAVGYYGFARPTGDIDVFIGMNPENAERMATAIHDFGFEEGVSAQMFLQPNKVFRMGYPPVRIEILTTISGIDFFDAYARRFRGEVDGIEVNLISLQDLKANKLASGRLKDLADLAELGDAEP